MIMHFRGVTLPDIWEKELRARSKKIPESVLIAREFRETL